MGKHLDLSKMAIIAVIILAFALRIYRLDHQSIWYDEGVSVYFANQGLKDLVAGVSADNHPPLHFFSLHLWLKLAGQSEFSIRFLSLISGVLSVPLLFKLGRELFNRRVGLLAAFLLSISPFHVWFSQEARMYTLAALLGLASVYTFVLLLRKGASSARRHIWLSYVVTSTLGLYTHFYVAFIILFENVVFLGQWILRQVKRQTSNVKRHESTNSEFTNLRTWLLAQLCIALLFLPWARFLATRVSADATYWEGALGLLTAAKDTFIAFSVGHTMGGRAADLVALGFVALAAVGVLASLWEWKLEVGSWKLEDGRGKVVHFPSSTLHPPSSIFQSPISNLQCPTGLVLLYLAVPIGALFAISYNRPKFASRYLLPALPAFYLLMAVGLGRLASSCQPKARGSRLLGTVALIGLLCSLGFVSGASAGSLANYYFDEEYARSDFRSVAEYISSRAEAKDAIILLGGHMLPAFTYYYRGELPVYPLPEGLVLSTKEPLDYRAAERLNSIVQGQDRLWLVLWQNRAVDPTNVIFDQLMLNCPRLEVGRNFHHEFALLLFSLENQPRFAPEPAHRHLTNFADQIQLLGYDLDSFRPEPGQTLHLALYWEALGEMDRDYLVFTHLIGDDERIYGQHDKIAASDAYPTSYWKKGTIIRDKYEILVLPDTPLGLYTLEVGLYTTYQGIERLPLKLGGDRVLLAQVEVGEWP
ncbi:MAG: glycosyltransferase family 39 protein [Anaerolineae bacterium]|nr:glycosyltransferase family 39 protein [Anaerolineae bacterium]